jgi:hypothetical protein
MLRVIALLSVGTTLPFPSTTLINTRRASLASACRVVASG